MKTIARINLLLVATLAAACNNSSKSVFGPSEGEVRSIVYLKSLCTKSPAYISSDMLISGTVIGNDEFGEFPRTLLIQDLSGGIEIAVDHPLLADDYPFGSRITVSCNGLALADYGGKIQLGAPPTGEYSVDRIPRAEAGRYIRTVEKPENGIRPVTLRFDEVASKHIDTYVRFDGVRFKEQGTWCYRDPETGKRLATEHTIIDPQGATFRIRTVGSCEYAAEPVPQGTGSVYGIIDYFNGEYSLRITRAGTEFATDGGRPTACLSAGRY